MTFEEKLKSLRLKNSMGQQAAAVVLGISVRQYQRFEAGEQRPGYDNLIHIADLFEVSLDWLTGRDCSRYRAANQVESEPEEGGLS